MIEKHARLISSPRTAMAESGSQEEAARLWRVNRTIHELVKDRVRLKHVFMVQSVEAE